MKTFKQYERQLNENSLEYYVNSIDESLIEEGGLLDGLKKIIKKGLSLTSSYYKKCNKTAQDLIKKQMKNNKLKKLRGRAWWDEWFAARDEFNEAWHKINPTNKDKRQEDRNKKKEEKNIAKEEAKKAKEKEKNKDKNEALYQNEYYDQINEGNEDFNKTKVLFSEEKFIEYAKVEGMIDAIIGGFSSLYDMAQNPNEENMDDAGRKELKEYVSSNLNRIQKMLASGKIKGDNVKDDEVKNGAERIKEMIAEYNKAKEKAKEEKEGNGDGNVVNKGKATDDSEQNIGLGNKDDVVTPQQVKTGVQQEIKDSAKFIAPLAKEAKIDGEALSDYVTALINSKFKEEFKNGDKTMLRWKGEYKPLKDIGTNKLIKGISAMIAGALICNSSVVLSELFASEKWEPNVSGYLKKMRNDVKNIEADKEKV